MSQSENEFNSMKVNQLFDWQWRVWDAFTKKVVHEVVKNSKGVPCVLLARFINIFLGAGGPLPYPF